MKKIYFLRSAPYNYIFDKARDLYENFDLVAKGAYNPSIDKSFNLNFKIKANLIFSSPSIRSIQTANLYGKEYKEVNLLSEVRYKMSDFIFKNEFFDKKMEPNIDLARSKFVSALINSSLSENFNEVIDRIDKLFSLLKKEDVKIIICISHGFMLKIIESYIKDRRLKDNPKLLLKYFSGKKETFKFNSGFLVNLNDDFNFVKYV